MGGPVFSSPQERVSCFFLSSRAGWDPRLRGELVNFIEGANKTLDCAIYDLRDPFIVHALTVVSKRRNVKLRIAFDPDMEVRGSPSVDPKPGRTVAAIQNNNFGDAALAVKEKHQHNRMHNKFLVRDSAHVWTGSANFTVGALDMQDNNAVIVDSPQLASMYSEVFEDLRGIEHKHPNGAASVSPKEEKREPVEIDKHTKVTPYFLPRDSAVIESAIVDLLKNAKRVRIMSYLISSQPILEALLRFQNPKADIRGIFDPTGMAEASRSNEGDRFWFLKDTKRFVAAPSGPYNPSETDFMSNKAMIIDDRTVITGSYNFSRDPENSDDNMLMINSSHVRGAFSSFFDAMFSDYQKRTKARS